MGKTFKMQLGLANGGKALVEIGGAIYTGDPVIVADAGRFYIVVASKAIKELRIVGRVTAVAQESEGDKFLLRSVLPGLYAEPLKKVYCSAIKQLGTIGTAKEYMNLIKYISVRCGREAAKREAVA